MYKANILFYCISCLFFACITNRVKITNQQGVNPSQFGAIGDGKHDDYKALQEAIYYAEKTNTSINLSFSHKYLYKSTLNITTSIKGSNSTLIPLLKGKTAVNISKDDLVIEDLNILGNDYGSININSNNITLKNCKLEGNNYYVLLNILGDGLTLLNSTIRNYYNQRYQYAIFSKRPVNNIILENDSIYGGILLENNLLKEVGNHVIKNCYIQVDFSHAKQTFDSQHDAIYFRGINNVVFKNNYFNFINVNRGFKFSDNAYNQSTDSVTEFPTNNIVLEGNDIVSNSINGKQLFDLYLGTGKVDIVKNRIKTRGHVKIFENKTRNKLKVNSILNIDNNVIEFDFRLLYVNGSYGKKDRKAKNYLYFTDNKLIYPYDSLIKLRKYAGQSELVDFHSLLDVRNIDYFQFNNNIYLSPEKYFPMSDQYIIKIDNVKKSNIESNKLQGRIQFNSNNTQNVLVVKGNIVDALQFQSFISTSSKEIEGQIIFDNNHIFPSNKNIVSKVLEPISKFIN